MKKTRKGRILIAVCLMLAGAVVLWGSRWVMTETNSTAFCVSCHSMEKPRAEWEGSSHFANASGVRAECADCHIPADGWHYVKAKFVALKDVWFEMTGKIDTPEKFETHRTAMAQRVWDELKATDSATCRSCHELAAMEFSEQGKYAGKTHAAAQAAGQTCIDCHKGIVHFMPLEQDTPPSAVQPVMGSFNSNSPQLYVSAMETAYTENGGEIRLMPFAEMTDWQDNGTELTGVLQGWQQAGAESLLYAALGKRITVAVLDDDAKSQGEVRQRLHDAVTDTQWQQTAFRVRVPKAKMTENSTALHAFGEQLNQTYCSNCHAAIGADHFTANQWIGIVNSMKDRTAISKEDVRTLTIYLQRNAKDMKPQP